LVKLKTILEDESGQSMIEYALIIGLVVVVAVIAVAAIGPRVVNLYQEVNNKVPLH